MFNSINKQDKFKELTPKKRNTADSFQHTLPRSKDKYIITYNNFMLWRRKKNFHSFSEDVFLAYLNKLVKKYKPTSLWSIYSMLKSTVQIKHGININTYTKLKPFLKRHGIGYRSKKSKVLSSKDIEKFLKEAPDQKYLVTKVALIFGITGACTRQELCNMTTKNIEDHGNLLLVTITSSRTKIQRSFIIHGPFYDTVKKYQALRSPKAKNYRFFQNYQKGKCTCQPIGINKFGSMPKEIAHFLKLPDPGSYTGHSFRRTSLDLLTDSKLDRLKLKGHIERAPNTDKDSNVEDSIQNEAEDSIQNEIEDSIQNETEHSIQNETEDSNQNETDESNKSETEDLIQMEIEELIQKEMEDSTTHSVDTEPPEMKFCPESIPITSKSYHNVTLPTHNDEEVHVFENSSPPTSSQDPISETINNNLTQTVRMSTNKIVYTFKNCTFTNCFKKSQ